MPSVSITWHTQHDDRVCKICEAIDGYTWAFPDQVPDSLIHPQWGEVWNTTLGSLAHEHQYHKGSKYGLISNCRCHIEPHFDLKDLVAKVKAFHDEIKEALDTTRPEADTT